MVVLRGGLRLLTRLLARLGEGEQGLTGYLAQQKLRAPRTLQ